MIRPLLFFAVASLVAAAPPVDAAHIPVDVLLQRMFVDASPAPYDVTADFEGSILITYVGGRVNARAVGTYREGRAAPGGPRRREVKINRLDVPLLLRPFRANLQRLIEERLEREEGTLALLDEYDMFIAEELPGGRFLLGGIRADIVTEVMRRYGRAEDIKDKDVRRAVARWLYQPRQRDMVVRSGSPYAVTVLVDEQGTYYSLVVLYEFGPIGTQIDWATVPGGRLIWREVRMDAAGDFPGFGHVETKLNLRFSNHCYNCRK